MSQEAGTHVSSIGQRKADHLEICANEDVGFRQFSTLFEDVPLVHDALADLDERTIDASCTLLGKKLKAPLIIAAMTGGTDEAGEVNRALARIAEEKGVGFGLGSQRAMHVRPETLDSYCVRDQAPKTLLLGNVGGGQA